MVLINQDVCSWLMMSDKTSGLEREKQDVNNTNLVFVLFSVFEEIITDNSLINSKIDKRILVLKLFFGVSKFHCY